MYPSSRNVCGEAVEVAAEEPEEEEEEEEEAVVVDVVDEDMYDRGCSRRSVPELYGEATTVRLQRRMLQLLLLLLLLIVLFTDDNAKTLAEALLQIRGSNDAILYTTQIEDSLHCNLYEPHKQSANI